jgi:pentatricopeptide repeat protein
MMLRAAAWRSCGRRGRRTAIAAASSVAECTPSSTSRSESAFADKLVLQQEMLQQVTNLGALGQWQEAFRLIEREPIESIGLAAKARGAIKGFGLGEQWQLAVHVLGKWQQEQVHVPSPVRKQLIDVLAGGGQLKMLMQLINELESQGVVLDLHSYTTAIKACSKNGQCEQALALLQQMQAQGLLANATCYAGAINACGRSGEWEQALQLLSSVKKLAPTRTPYAHVAAIKACGVSGRWQQALQILDDMSLADDAPSNGRVYCAAITACAHSAKWQQAVELLHKAAASVTPAAPLLATAYYTATITACGIAGQHSAALQLFAEMQSRGLVPSTRAVSAAVTACAAAGQWALAVQLLQAYAEEHGFAVTVSSNDQRAVALELLLQLRARSSDIVLDTVRYYTAIVVMSASGEVHKADELYRRLLTSGLVQPWSTEEVDTLDVSSLYTTAVAEAAIRTALSDMCSYTSATTAAMTAAECSSGQQYYIHDPATDLHISIRPQQCSSTADAADSTDENANCSDESDSDEFSSVLQLCVTELLEQLSIVFTVDDTDGRVIVPAASLQQYIYSS